ncbi:MAG: TolC family protein [Flavipsychrobacter sp.]
MTQFKKMRIVKGLQAGVICILSCIYQPSHGQTLSLYDAVNKTLTNYPLLQERQAEVAAGKAHIRTVEGDRLPSLKLHDQVNVGTANSDVGSFFPMGVVVPTAGSIRPENVSTAASGNIAVSLLEWQFYTFGYYNAQKRQAEASLAVNQARYNSDRYLLTENIISLYLDWLKKYRLLQIESENLDRERTVLNAITANVRSGLKPGVDSSTANAEYTRNYITYLQAANAYQADKIAIANYSATDTNATTPDTSIFADNNLQKLLSVQPTDSLTLAHPLLDYYQKQYDLQVANNKTISRKFLPRFSLEGAAWMRGSSISPEDVYSSNLADGLSYNRYNYLAGLAVTYDLFDLKRRHDELAEGKYNAMAMKSALQTQTVDLTKLGQQVDVSYANTLQKLNALPVELQSAQQAYQQQIALYKSGLNTLIDVTNALYVLKQTETDMVLTQDDLLQLLYMRAGLSNQLDLFLQNFKQ